MSKQSSQKKKQQTGRAILMILLAVVIMAVIVTVVILLANDTRGLGGSGNELPVIDVEGENRLIEIPFEIPGFTLIQEAEVGKLEGDLELLGVGRYSGEFFEDGSDEPITEVYAAVVRNNGEDWVDFAVLTMSCGAKTLTFELSALPGSTSALLLETGRTIWTAGDSCSNPHAVITEDTTEHIFSFEETFTLYPSDGVINLQNISDKTFRNDILVYYKNFDYGLFLGGITYRARFSGLAPEQIGQSIQSHYSDARSTILYLTYDD